MNYFSGTARAKIQNFGFVLFPVIIAALVNFATLPIVYRGLSKLEAGIWFLLIDLSAFALAFDFGISNILIRKMAQYKSNEIELYQDFHSSRKSLGSIMFGFMAIGFFALFIYSIYVKYDLIILIICILFILSTCINVYSYPFVGLIRIRGKFSSIALTSGISNFAYLGIILTMINQDYKLITLSLAYFIRNLISYFGFKYFTKDTTLFKFTDIKFSYTKEHFTVFLNTATFYVYFTIESLLLSIFFAPTAVAIYIAHRKLFDFTKSGVDAYLTSIYPKMAQSTDTYFDRRGFIFLFSTFLVYTILFGICIPTMELIAGSNYTLDPVLIFLICIQFISNGFSIYIRQKNIALQKSSKALISSITELFLKITISLILIPILKYNSLPIASTIGALVSILIGSSSVWRVKK